VTFRVPFNRVEPVGRELAYLQAALSGGHISGHGPFTARAEAQLEDLLGARRVLLTTSCTHALELCALLLDIQPGDEVIMPSFTFVSTASAFALRGARPIFVDICEDTLNIDPARVEAAITPRTRAIVVVHYAGVACDMEALGRLAVKHGLPIVEDNAHGLFGKYRDRQLGTFGTLATLSFHETKNISCGEGGALIVNDPTLVDRAEVLREKGTDRSRFLRGEVDRYTWQDLGSSYIPSDLLAGFLCGQLEARATIQGRRRAVFERYREALGTWAHEYGVSMLTERPGCAQPFHMFYLRLPDPATRTSFLGSLHAAGVLAVSHYVPLHTSPMGRRLGYQAGDLPVTERASAQLVRLPFYTTLSEADQTLVCDEVGRLTPGRREVIRG